MLVIIREINESIEFQLDSDADPNMTVGELFALGSIKVMVVDKSPTWVRIGIEAPKVINIARSELLKG